ncbi:hypothetical protein V3C99_002469 [Haemonchus contortus]
MKSSGHTDCGPHDIDVVSPFNGTISTDGPRTVLKIVREEIVVVTNANNNPESLPIWDQRLADNRHPDESSRLSYHPLHDDRHTCSDSNCFEVAMSPMSANHIFPNIHADRSGCRS